MNRIVYRKSAPKVRDGKVQHKNRHDFNPRYPFRPQVGPEIYRERPGSGYRHLMRKNDMARFIQLLPDWDELSRGLRAIVLATGEPGLMGWHYPGVVAVCAWERELSGEWYNFFVDEHREILDRLGVRCEPHSDRTQLCHFTQTSARGFQLMHILLHELGHHHDRMTTKSKLFASRGEAYAEEYALAYAGMIWDRYLAAFGW